jgi:hypothetical protein
LAIDRIGRRFFTARELERIERSCRESPDRLLSGNLTTSDLQRLQQPLAAELDTASYQAEFTSES